MGEDRSRLAGLDGSRNEVVEVTESEIVDAIEESAPGIARRVTQGHSLHIRSEDWSGPLPRPSDLAEYEAVLPGLADRIVKMAETAMENQTAVERTLATGDVEAVRRGQYLSTAVVVVTLIGAIVAALLKLPWLAVAFLLPSIVQFAPKLIRSVREPASPEHGTQEPREPTEPDPPA
ncbi:DUF2335 domain-containing protein [Rhodococcus aetherivorans]